MLADAAAARACCRFNDVSAIILPIDDAYAFSLLFSPRYARFRRLRADSAIRRYVCRRAALSILRMPCLPLVFRYSTAADIRYCALILYATPSLMPLAALLVAPARCWRCRCCCFMLPPRRFRRFSMMTFVCQRLISPLFALCCHVTTPPDADAMPPAMPCRRYFAILLLPRRL